MGDGGLPKAVILEVTPAEFDVINRELDKNVIAVQRGEGEDVFLAYMVKNFGHRAPEILQAMRNKQHVNILFNVVQQPRKPVGWYGVDLDGTLAHYDGWMGPTEIGPPISKMVHRVRRWLAEGRDVRIFTARVALNVVDEASIERILQHGVEIGQPLESVRETRGVWRTSAGFCRSPT